MFTRGASHANGNLTRRTDLNQSGSCSGVGYSGKLCETFVHDSLDRLDTVSRNGTLTLDVDYYLTGNITQRLDVCSYSYDANGNVTSRNGVTRTWASYDLPTTVAGNGWQSQFWCGPDRNRWKQVATTSAVIHQMNVRPSEGFQSSMNLLIRREKRPLLAPECWAHGMPAFAAKVACYGDFLVAHYGCIVALVLVLYGSWGAQISRMHNGARGRRRESPPFFVAEHCGSIRASPAARRVALFRVAKRARSSY